MTRQRKWQIKQLEQGLCLVCGDVRVTNHYCEKHRVQTCERQNRKNAINRMLRMSSKAVEIA